MLKLRKNGLVSASIIVVALGLGSSVLSLIREQWIAHRFGVGGMMDMFSIAWAGPLFAAGLIGSAINAAVIPAYLRAQKAGESSRFLVNVGALVLVVAGAFSVIASISCWVLMPYLASGFDSVKLSGTRVLAALLSPLIVVHAFSSFLDGILNSRKSYVAAAIGASLIPIGAILIFASTSSIALWVIVAGLYVGYLLKVAAQVVYLRAMQRPSGEQQAFLRLNTWGRYIPLLKEASALLVSSAILGVLPIIGQAYAATFSTGSVASLAYAGKLVNLGLAMAGSAINAVLFPLLAEHALERASAAAEYGTQLALKVTLVTGLLALPVYLAAEPIVSFVFERGAFNGENVRQVAGIFRYMLLQVPFYVAGLILARVVVVLGISRVFVFGNILSLGIYWLACLLLTRFLGVQGIGLALAIVYFVSFLYLSACIRRNEIVLRLS